MNDESLNGLGLAKHQNQLHPEDNKFHKGNGSDGKHYWLTPPELFAELNAEFQFDFDPCPYPLPDGFDGLTCEWGQSNYVNPPFGSIIHEGRKKGPTAWVRKAIIEWEKGKRVVLVYPVDKWLLMLTKSILGEHADIRNLGDVKWCATEDGSPGKGTGRHIACFILNHPCEPKDILDKQVNQSHAIITRLIGYAGHDVECKLNIRMGSEECTCGYSAAIADAREFLEGESDDE